MNSRYVKFHNNDKKTKLNAVGAKSFVWPFLVPLFWHTLGVWLPSFLQTVLKTDNIGLKDQLYYYQGSLYFTRIELLLCAHQWHK